MRKKYFALRLIASVLKVFAWLTLILGLISFVVTMVLGGMFYRAGAMYGLLTGHIPMASLGLFGALLLFVLLYAAAEVIYVSLDIEENTRRCAELLAKKE
jgi:uncharacterized membrane protein